MTCWSVYIFSKNLITLAGRSLSDNNWNNFPFSMQSSALLALGKTQWTELWLLFTWIEMTPFKIMPHTLIGQRGLKPTCKSHDCILYICNNLNDEIKQFLKNWNCTWCYSLALIYINLIDMMTFEGRNNSAQWKIRRNKTVYAIVFVNLLFRQGRSYLLSCYDVVISTTFKNYYYSIINFYPTR